MVLRFWAFQKYWNNGKLSAWTKSSTCWGLMGDSSDNVPGIPGIGPKTAQKLIAQYDSVEGLLDHVDELKGKQKENVETYREPGPAVKRIGYHPPQRTVGFRVG